MLSILFSIPSDQQVQNYCASWAPPTSFQFDGWSLFFVVLSFFYTRVRVHATQKTPFLKVVVHLEAQPVTTENSGWKKKTLETKLGQCAFMQEQQ